MRLTDFEKNTIKKIAKNIFGTYVKIFLFGSRVDDSIKGGDIDLFIETANLASLQDKISFISKLKLKLGDQKIDVVVNSPEQKAKRIFRVAKENGIEI
jgi:predicted nucleotidyltransferase